METCPCGSGNPYSDCCEPLIEDPKKAQTAEILMRSRYTAFVKKEFDHIHETTHATKREEYSTDGGASWTKNFEWMGLEIVRAENGGPEDTTGTVEFIARYRKDGSRFQHHEVAEFSKEDDQWFFKDGQPPAAVQSIRQGPKVGRNEPCPCNSGKKYKKCCGR
ncbi:MAG: YchJ family protein [Desulfobacteraceae bacterium]|nr:YchJ family protein [Desulfobacteraceae bacterium]